MSTRRISRHTALCATLLCVACSPSGGGDSSGSGGKGSGGAGTGGTPMSSGSGGALSSGGATATGGTVGGSGGAAVGTGGSPVGTGGSPAGTGGAIGGNDSGGQGGTAGAGLGGRAGAAGGGSGSGTTGGGGAKGDAVRSSGCGKTRTLKDGHLTISSGGMNRTYYLNSPANYDNMHPYRLIFAFHWNGGSGNSIVNPPDQDHNIDQPYYGLLALSGDTTIYVAPDGIGAGWANTGNRDVTFTDDMLMAIENDLCIDTSRVFTTGFSYGGAMSWKLACVRTEKFRAAAVYDAGPVSGNNNAECTKPIAWFQSHGFDDGIFNYKSTGLPILNLFAKLDGCTMMTPADPPTNGHTCVSFQGCVAATPVRFCNFGHGEDNTHAPGGHYPSAKDPGQTVSWIPAEVWAFFTQF